MQYGRMSSHENEEARSRFIAAVRYLTVMPQCILTLRHLIQIFSEIVCLFGCTIVNKPEGLLDFDLTKKGRIEYYFYALDSISIVFIEVKKEMVAGRARLDVIAQVLAECAGMSKASYHES
jgi:hypothetical protein